jgi:hypothetical protein
VALFGVTKDRSAIPVEWVTADVTFLLRLLELHRLFETKQLMQAAGTTEFLMDLAAAGTGAAGAVSKSMFHSDLLGSVRLAD